MSVILSTGDRESEIEANLREVRSRIEAGCEAADRDPALVRLIVVPKTYPVSDIRLLHQLGHTDIGENSDQEALDKRAACMDLPLTWHMIGQVQQRKASSVAGWADVVHSIDRTELVERLGRAAAIAAKKVAVFIQVSLDPQVRAARGGLALAEVVRLADSVLSFDSLDLLGVMGVAPHPGDPDEAFARLALALAAMQERAPKATQISAGMSGDLEAALYHGATQVRLGGAVLGIRSRYP